MELNNTHSLYNMLEFYVLFFCINDLFDDLSELDTCFYSLTIITYKFSFTCTFPSPLPRPLEIILVEFDYCSCSLSLYVVT